MPCHTYRGPDGVKAILCGRRLPRLKPCAVCKHVTSEVLCDGREPGRPGTCDLPLCRSCALHHDRGRDGVDFCPRHRHQAPPAEQMGLAL